MHQPNYLPWLGYFYKMAEVDVFVYLDVVQIPRGRSFAARNVIKTSQGPRYLTVPLASLPGRHGKIRYTEARFADAAWKKKHLTSLRLNYARAPFFDDIYPILEQEIRASQNLLGLNVGLIEALAQYLEIGTRRLRLSQALDEWGQKTQLVVDICQSLGASVYVSGRGGGRDYNDDALMNQHGIELRYSSFRHPLYPQLWGDFEYNLTTVDLLFNCGKESREILVGPLSSAVL
jgi:hypothetical protein